MNLTRRLIDKSESLWPEDFNFYQLGMIEKNDQLSSSQDYKVPGLRHLINFDIETNQTEQIGFRLKGEVKGLIVFRFEQGLDLSLYTEIGNTLASKFATRLSNENLGEAMISPPYPISLKVYQSLQKYFPICFKKIYYFKSEKWIPCELSFFIDSKENQINV